jgi:hypothetical protein
MTKQDVNGAHKVDDHNVTSAPRAPMKKPLKAFIDHFKLSLRDLQRPAG